MWEFVDKVIYINLDHRQDRRDIMKKFFEKGKFPADKIVRFPAIKHQRGTIGCTESHAEVLRIAKRNKWKNVLILEDDLEWLDLERQYPILEKLAAVPKWDVIMLMGWYYQFKFPRVYYANHTSAYLVNSTYYDKLLKNREEALYKVKTKSIGFNFNTTIFNADVYWNHLMKVDTWYCLHPCICRQVDGFSDIGKRTRETSKAVGVYDVKIRNEVYK